MNCKIKCMKQNIKLSPFINYYQEIENMAYSISTFILENNSISLEKIILKSILFHFLNNHQNTFSYLQNITK